MPPITSNSNAIAVWNGTAWIIQPLCSDGTASGFNNAVAINVGDGYVLVPVRRVSESHNAITIHASDADILLPIGCEDKTKKNPTPPPEPCVGDDPLCSDCACAAALASSYTITISGFPSICSANTFNGSWTVSHNSNCAWVYDIDAFHRVTLMFVSASNWRVTWAVTSPGGANGYFSGSGDIAACTPIAYTYAHDFCFQPFLCFNLCSSISASGSVSVSA